MPVFAVVVTLQGELPVVSAVVSQKAERYTNAWPNWILGVGQKRRPLDECLLRTENVQKGIGKRKRQPAPAKVASWETELQLLAVVADIGDSDYELAALDAVEHYVGRVGLNCNNVGQSALYFTHIGMLA